MTHLAAGDRARALESLRQEVFEQHSLLRQRIYDMSEFAALRNDPEFRRITGHPDTTRWSRDTRELKDPALEVVFRMIVRERSAPRPQ